MKLVKVHDEYLQFFKWRCQNGSICCVLSCTQLVVTCAALGQHIYSLLVFREVLKCQFNATLAQAQPYLACDIIVYDFGLFHRLWEMESCIANYLDGGYMRLLWCVNQVLVLSVTLLLLLCLRQPSRFMLWPALILQSTYAIGLLILTLSSLPKFLPSIFDQLGKDSFGVMLIYLLGASMNFFFTNVLWHYYWHIEQLDKQRQLLDAA